MSLIQNQEFWLSVSAGLDHKYFIKNFFLWYGGEDEIGLVLRSEKHYASCNLPEQPPIFCRDVAIAVCPSIARSQFNDIVRRNKSDLLLDKGVSNCIVEVSSANPVFFIAIEAQLEESVAALYNCAYAEPRMWCPTLTPRANNYGISLLCDMHFDPDVTHH